MHAMLAKPWVAGLRAVWSSEEQKAMDGAAILAKALGIPHHVLAALHENDRSATGYLPKAEFEETADRFFAEPETSVRGWERATDAQARIIHAVDTILERHGDGGDLAIVGHGGVGTLLLCHLMHCPIDRRFDQPPGQGGYYFAFEAKSRALLHGWRLIDGLGAVSGPGHDGLGFVRAILQ
jgi:broad specificity phosphatase PhoE